jgi:hypothetical protein
MADSSRNILLAVLVVGVAVAVFYMMDPTFGGLMGKREGFQDAMAPTMAQPAMQPAMPEPPMLPPNNPASVTGMQMEKFQNPAGDATKEMEKVAAQLQNAMASIQKEKPTQPFQDFKKKEMFQGANGDKKAMAVEGFENPASTPFPEAAQPANCYPKNQLAPQELLPADPNSKWASVNPTGAGDISGKNFLSAGALIGVNTVGQSLRNANQQLRSEPPCPQAQVSIWNQSTIEPDLQRRPLEGF